jgi:penicillin-binding protein 2
VRTATLPDATTESTRLRLMFVATLVLCVFVLLVSRLWFIQVVAGERYAAQAERNRVRAVSLEAPRGRVLDRSGRVLVDNRQVHVLGVRTDEMGDRRDRVLSELARLLGISVVQIRDRIARAPHDPARPVPVAFDVPERIALFVWEHQSTRFPGVYADLVPRRSYPHGRLAAHVLGYTGQITSELLDDPVYARADPGAQAGMAGIERSYERTLRGIPGRRELEIDAAGDVVRQISERLPTPGADLRLTIDLDVQRLAEHALARGIVRARKLTDRQRRGNGRFAAPAGAVVVLEPGTGALRAVASYPTFAPEAFVGGIATDSYAALLDPAAHAPLVNRAVQSTYPPGSVFKIVSAAAAMRHGFATPRTTFPCPGTWRWNAGGERSETTTFRNWTSADLGDMTLSESLTQSCDTVFYELAKRMWEAEERNDDGHELVGREARRFGFGALSGVDLPGEEDGVVPGRRWRRRVWEANRDGYCEQARRASDDGTRRLLTELCSPVGAQWRGGDAVNMAIGQGAVLASPLQVAVSMAAIANTGVVPRPHVAAAVQRAGGSNRPVPVAMGTRLDLDPDVLEVIRQGLEGVTAPGGTAADAFARSALPVAGKTGTAEAGSDQPFAWFAGYGPTTDARFVVAVVVEQGGSGSRTAAPIARQIFDGLAAIGRGSTS